MVKIRGAVEEAKAKKKGNSSTSSTSKIRKIRAIRKNRIEKGSRALSFLLNPHSKGLSLFRSVNVFAESAKASAATKAPIKSAIKKFISNISIRRKL